MAERGNKPVCPRCEKPMRLARTIPAVRGHPEIKTFQCQDCGEVRSELHEEC